MKTIVDKKETTQKLTTKYPYKMEDFNTITFSVTGQVPERTLEDRSVYFEIKTNIYPKPNELQNNTVDVYQELFPLAFDVD